MFTAMMDLSEECPPGESLTGALKVFNEALREKDSGLVSEFRAQGPPGFLYEGIYISWHLHGTPTIDGVEGERQLLPVLIHSKNGEPYIVGQHTKPLPPYLMAELKEYDRILREMLG